MTEYESRERRLESITSRMRDALDALVQCEQSRQGQRAWLRQNHQVLASWPDALGRYTRLRPSDVPLSEARTFSRWARRQRWANPALLALRLECVWLRVRLWTIEARQGGASVNREIIVIASVVLLLFGFAALLLLLL
jgi:hypothetical protein